VLSKRTPKDWRRGRHGVDELLSRDALDSALLELAAQQMERLRVADPDAWRDYVEEGRTWEEGTVEPQGTVEPLGT